MIQKISSTLQPLTRELAQKFSQMRALPGERLKRASRLHYFDILLKDGKFGSPNWSEALIGDDPEPWRGDGQHTSHLLAYCDDKLFPTNLNVTIHSYHLDSIAEAGAFFELFDNPRSARTNQDKLNVYRAQHPEIQHIDPGFLGKVLAGLHWFNVQLIKDQSNELAIPELKLPPKRDLGLYLDDRRIREFALWMNRWAQTKHTWMIGKPGITAEIYADWKAQPDMATQFWDEVLNESNPDRDDETRELVRTFLDWNHRQPATDQERFRSRAKKIWDRYHRTHRTLRSEPATETAVTMIPPPANEQLETRP